MGHLVGGYAAVNSFMESFSEFQNSKTGYRRHYCFAWSVWDGVGMSHGYQRTARIRASGYYAISPVQGIQSLMAGLSHYPAPLLIGLDGGKQPIRRLIAAAEPLNQLTAHIRMRTSGKEPSQLLSLRPLVDCFGNQTSCQLLYDSDETMSHPVRLMTQREEIEPRHETERILVEQWQKQLGKSGISIYDNYFELGGTSILAVQLMYQRQDIFAMELPINLLLSKPTIEQIAKVIEALKQGDRSSLDMPTSETTPDKEEMRKQQAEAAIQKEVNCLDDEELEKALAAEISGLEDLLESL
ncbi:MAG: phosphopantetheine-binding protein [Cyanobacteria bacterium P01_F01_bin.53]